MRIPRQLLTAGTAAITAGVAFLTIVPSVAQAAPDTYRQLDAAGLIGVLPSGTEAPAWLGRPVEANTESRVPSEGMTICNVGDERSQVPSAENTIFTKDITGLTPSLSAYSFVNFGRFPTGGYSNMISSIAQFPSAAAADAAWKDLVAKSPACAAPWSLPYPADDGTWNGMQQVRGTVSAGTSLYGSPSLVITSASSGTREGASAPSRTGGSLTVWRHLGNVIYRVQFSKAVLRDVRSAVSVSDRMTVNALSALIGERYMTVAGG